MKLLYTLIALCFALSAQGQNDELIDPRYSEIRQVIDSLFEGMRTSDSTLVFSLFRNDATLKSVSRDKRTKEVVVYEENLGEFLIAIGTPKDDLWDERISNVILHIDEVFAQVWMDYEFYLNDQFSHCGVNSFQLIKGDNGWKILNITDTRKRNECDEIKSRE